MTGEIYIGGHSLGAAEAYEYAYSRVKRGLRVDGVYCLAPPRPGTRLTPEMVRTTSAGCRFSRK